MDNRYYPGVEADVTQLMTELRRLFDGDDAYEVQTMQVSSTTVLQARKAGTPGVLKLTLNSGSYSWEFVPVEGEAFTDSGTTGCH